MCNEQFDLKDAKVTCHVMDYSKKLQSKEWTHMSQFPCRSNCPFAINMSDIALVMTKLWHCSVEVSHNNSIKHYCQYFMDEFAGFLMIMLLSHGYIVSFSQLKGYWDPDYRFVALNRKSIV